MRALTAFFLIAHTCYCFTDVLEDGALIGKLDNGLTYYIQKNNTPKKKTALRLIVKVGSLHEEEEERGIAHCVEHLVFRGTDEYQDGEIEKYLESLGAWFGTDHNAYTTFDHTLYQIDVPMHSPEVIGKCLNILKNIAGAAHFKEECVNIEKNVIIDELNQGDTTPLGKLMDRYYELSLEDSRLGKRMPGGLKEIVQGISHDTLDRFYKKWYRPDRMAVMVIGNIEPEEIQKEIYMAFDLPPSSVPMPQEVTFDIPRFTQNKAVVHFDPFIGTTSLALGHFYQFTLKDVDSEETIKQVLLDEYANQLLDRRLSKLGLQPESPITTAGLANDEFIDDIYHFLLEASFFQGKELDGIYHLRWQIQNALSSGFSKAEWDVLKKQQLTLLEKELKNLHKTPHDEFIESYLDHFLYNEPIISKKTLLKKIEEYTTSIEVDAINTSLKDSHVRCPAVLFLATSSEKVRDEIQAQDLLDIFDHKQGLTSSSSSQQEKMPEYRIETALGAGQIVEEKTDPEFDVTYLTLSNGIRVNLKYNEATLDQVLLYADAEGGLSSILAGDYPSARLAESYYFMSGFDGLSYPDFIDFCDAKGINIDLCIGRSRRNMHLQSGKENMEVLFQWIHELFTKPTFDKNQWEQLLQHAKEELSHHQKDPVAQFWELKNKINSQDHYFYKPLDLAKVDCEKAEDLFKKLFSNPKEFTFSIVGDFDKQKVMEYLEKYISCLPSSDEASIPKAEIKELFPQEKIQEDFKKGSNAFATTSISIPFDAKALLESSQSIVPLRAVVKILDQRLYEELRRNYGGTYSVVVDFSFPYYPSFSNATIEIEFTSAPHLCHEMAAMVLEEIREFCREMPGLGEVETIKALLLAPKNESNWVWINAFNNLRYHNMSLQEFFAKEPINELTPESLNQAAKIIFASPHYSIIHHIPEELSQE